MQTTGLNENFYKPLNFVDEEEINDEEKISFTPPELDIFVREIKDMISEGKNIDVKKAIHNARYLAEIDRRIADVKAGKNVVEFTEEEWENYIKEQNLE